MKGALVYIAAAIAAVSFLYLYSAFTPKAVVPLRTVHIGSQTIKVTVAQTPEERQKGLSGREGLATDEGMLFVFPTDGKYAFWMKDMRFSIDILWLSSDGTIVHLAQNVSPDTYPKNFTSESAARYVLELPAGYAASNLVRVGDIVQL
ncbi:MAG: DUF192 domain-containing protein [bacterium]|nr:DUF192 domain-containing protein [bacterium]